MNKIVVLLIIFFSIYLTSCNNEATTCEDAAEVLATLCGEGDSSRIASKTCYLWTEKDKQVFIACANKEEDTCEEFLACWRN